MIESLPYFTYKGTTSMSQGLIIEKKSTYAGAERDVEYLQIPGRSGDLMIDKKRYKNVPIEYSVIALDRGVKSIAQIAHDVKGWLAAEIGYFELTDTYDPNYYRVAAFNDRFDIEQELPFLGKAKILFNCKPYKYLISGKSTITLTSHGAINNPELFPSLPYIKITGSGDITLTINNKNFVFRSVSEYIEIDSETMNAYKGTLSQNTKMFTPKFPKLAAGSNEISWSGNVEKIEITPRWCCL